MPEYINKDKLLGDIVNVDISDCTDVDDIFSKVEEAIDNQPTADVVEVRHGEWVGRCGTGQYDDYYCSLCGMYEEGTRNKDRLGNYCPNCGAKMDRERMI